MRQQIKAPIEAVFNAPTFGKLARRGRKKRAWLLLTPQYLNYGDHAIAQAETLYFSRHFPQTELVEITYNFYQTWPKRLEKAVSAGDLLLVTGGGYMGDLWPEAQRLTEDILKRFPQNPVVILPQTIFFRRQGTMLEQAKRAFSAHKNLWVFLRDVQSYEFTKANLMAHRPERCFLVPDMVVSMDAPQNLARQGVLTVFRKDLEGVGSEENRRLVSQYLAQKNIPVREAYMARDHVEIPAPLRRRFLRRKLAQYAQAELVITDRLHGMLFAYITHTPCLAFDNISGKVKGAYRWIAANPLVQLAAREDLARQMDTLWETRNKPWEPAVTEQAFAPLRNTLAELLQKEE